MKKVFSIFAVAAIMMVGCKPANQEVVDPNKDKPADPSETPTVSEDPAPVETTVEKIVKTAYIEAVCDWPEENDWKAVRIGETKWEFEYDDYGRVLALKNSDKAASYIFDYTEDFKSCDVLVEENEDIVKYQLTLNDKLLCTKMVDNTADPAETWTYEYDADGYQIKASKNGEVKTEYVIQNGNIFTWSRDGSRLKEHKYNSTDNVADLHTSYSEDAGLSRLFYETGLFGRSSVKVCTEAKWQDRDSKATYEYEFDKATNGITHETKYYGGDYDFDVNFEVAKKTFKAVK
ncbi:MAG: hypothetical protein IJ652_03865 [Bacteroidales bacterium]|nr:hypothetical protein [Bacteroidales bacterium]